LVGSWAIGSDVDIMYFYFFVSKVVDKFSYDLYPETVNTVIRGILDQTAKELKLINN